MQSTYKRVGECLYQSPESGTIFAALRHKGKQIKRSLKSKSLPEARRKLVDLRKELERVDPDLSRVTVSDRCDKYVEMFSHQAKSTTRQKRDICKKIKEKFGEIRIRELLKTEILRWISSLKLSPNGYNKHLRVIRTILALAVDDRIIPVSPLAGVKQVKVPTPIRLTPTEEEFEAIVASIRSQLWADTAEESADFVEFMGLEGLGLAETATLSWSDVRWESEQIITYRHKTKKGFGIPIYPQVRPLLERRYKAAVMANGGKAPPHDAKVFSISNPKKAIEAACQRLGLPPYTSRAFRRCFITTAIERSIDVKVIAEWQGHKDGGKLILNTYSHVRAKHSQNMAKLMTKTPPLPASVAQGPAVTDSSVSSVHPQESGCDEKRGTV